MTFIEANPTIFIIALVIAALILWWLWNRSSAPMDTHKTAAKPSEASSAAQALSLKAKDASNKVAASTAAASPKVAAPAPVTPPKPAAAPKAAQNDQPQLFADAPAPATPKAAAKPAKAPVAKAAPVKAAPKPAAAKKAAAKAPAVTAPAPAKPVVKAPAAKTTTPTTPAAKAAPKPAAKTAVAPAAKAAPTPKPAAKPAPKPKAPVAKAAPKATKPDDLLQLKGVGPKLAKLLGELGVTSFKQIAAFKAADIARVDAQLGTFRGRITRDNWIEQAGYLAKGDIKSFEAKFGKLDSEN